VVPTLSSRLWRSTYLRVAPSHEFAVASTWLTSTTNASGAAAQSESALFVALGPCDLVVLSPLQTAETMARAGTIPGVVGFQDSDHYEWTGKTDAAAVLTSPVCAFVSLYLNPDLASGKMTEVKLERSLATLVRDRNTADSKAVLLGGFGSASNLLLIGADTVADLFRVVHEFLLSVHTRFQPPTPVIRRSGTLITARCEMRALPLPGSDGFRDAILRLFPAPMNARTFAAMAHASVAIQIRCRTGNINAILTEARNVWPSDASVATTYGSADIRIQLPFSRFSTIGELLADVLCFRNQTKHLMTETESPTVTIDAESASAIASMDSEASSILRTFYAFSERLVEDCGSDLRDMGEFYAVTLEEARRLSEQFARLAQLQQDEVNEYQADLRELYAQLEMGQVGQIQRLDASTIGGAFGLDLGPYRSGIRRILWASDAIPWYVLNRVLRHQWGGFVIAGRMRDAFRTIAPVMNFPGESLLQPQDWWGLTHEACHTFVEDIPDQHLSFDQPLWTTAFGAMEDNWRLYKGEWERLAVECLVDAFETMSVCVAPTQFGWEDHQRITWEYVLAHYPLQVSKPEYLQEHIRRSMFAVLSVENVVPPAGVFNTLFDIVEECCDHTGLDLPDDAITRFRADALAFAQATKGARNWLKSRCKTRKILTADETLEADRRSWMSDPIGYESCRNNLEHGIIVEPSKLRHPDLLVWRLKRRNSTSPLSAQTKIATILSLLWFFLENGLSDFSPTAPQKIAKPKRSVNAVAVLSAKGSRPSK